jgi:hypothetical protein
MMSDLDLTLEENATRLVNSAAVELTNKLHEAMSSVLGINEATDQLMRLALDLYSPKDAEELEDGQPQVQSIASALEQLRNTRRCFINMRNTINVHIKEINMLIGVEQSRPQLADLAQELDNIINDNV